MIYGTLETFWMKHADRITRPGYILSCWLDIFCHFDCGKGDQWDKFMLPLKQLVKLKKVYFNLEAALILRRINVFVCECRIRLWLTDWQNSGEAPNRSATQIRLSLFTTTSYVRVSRHSSNTQIITSLITNIISAFRLYSWRSFDHYLDTMCFTPLIVQ